jgi:hypothetical protein
MKKLYLTILCFFLMCSVGWAATINATDCTVAAINTAITASSTGDTVTIKGGTACTATWADAVTIPSSKKITLQGSGMDSTVITGGDGWKAIDMTTSGSRVTGIGFISIAGNSATAAIAVDGDGWRIDHCRFSSDIFQVSVSVYGLRENNHPTGLVDSCIFHNMRVIVDGFVGGSIPTAHALAAQPLNLGSGDVTPVPAGVVYIENNTFTYNVGDSANAVDANAGGRYVFRYNTLNGTYVEAHATLYSDMGTRKWEIYNNIINSSDQTIFVPMELRGGTGVIFNNTLTGFSMQRIQLDNRRSCETTSTGGLCDGSSPWDGNTTGLSGYPCRGQIGRSTHQWNWTTENPYPPEELAPAYAWNNRIDTNDLTFVQSGCALSIEHIQPNRDYYDYNASFDGTSGVGRGVLSSRPATCTTGAESGGGVSYFATDQGTLGTLYKCTATNTWTSYFAPYTCPHPLAGLTGSCNATAGTGGYNIAGGSGNLTIGTGAGFKFSGAGFLLQ